jgi:hypothetical protein
MIVKFVGNESTSIELQQGLIALSNFARGLRGGNTPFVLELTKDDTGTKLTVQTFRDVDPSSAGEPTEPTPTSEVKSDQELTIQPVRRGRKLKSVGIVSTAGVEGEGEKNDQETATGST